jgi:hypothetical protein
MQKKIAPVAMPQELEDTFFGTIAMLHIVSQYRGAEVLCPTELWQSYSEYHAELYAKLNALCDLCAGKPNRRCAHTPLGQYVMQSLDEAHTIGITQGRETAHIYQSS